MATPKYPAIEVELLGHSGNAFRIIGTVNQALRRAGVSPEERKEFQDAAMAGDYDNVLTVCMEWVGVT